MTKVTTSNPIYFVDAYALIYRAYFAFIKNPIVNSKGQDTSAMMGFINSIFDLIRKEQADHICVVFDTHKKTDRVKIYDQYKANREKTPEGISFCIPYIKEWLDAMGIERVELDGYEADDLVGTLAKKAEKEGYTVYMVTPDKDYAQLVSDNIYMYKPASRFSGVQKLGRAEIVEKYGFEYPEQMIDFLGMMGDASDNIPGLPGVGEKTALKFIKEYGSMEGLFENIDKLKGKMKERVEENQHLGLISKKLATIILDAPVEVDFAETTFKPQKEEVLALFESLEFTRLKTQFLKLFSEEPKTQQQFLDFETGKEEKAVWVQQIRNQQELSLLLKNSGDTLAIDTHGWVVCSDVMAHQVQIEWLESFVEEALSLEKRIVVEDLKKWFKTYPQYRQKWRSFVEAPILAHAVNASTRKNIDELYKIYVKRVEKNVFKSENPIAEGDQEKVESLVKQKAAYLALEKEVKELKLESLIEKERELAIVLGDLESEGIVLDVDSLAVLSEELEKDIVSLEKQIFESLDEEFNLASPKQLGEVLFEKKKLVEKPPKTKTGAFSTAEDVLLKYVDKHPVFQQILDWRGMTKLKNTYVDALPKHIDKSTGKVHAEFLQLGTVTGRLSSANPNLQNLPINTEKGKLIRKAVVTSSSDKLLLAADYSQIELRVIAAMSGEEKMIADFQKGVDIHTATAAHIFDKSPEEVTREERSNAKTVNFGIIYGVSAFGLSRQTDLSRVEAKEFIEMYHRTYPKIQAYIDAQIEKARQQSFVETTLGRRRFLNDIHSQNAMVRSGAERNAVNTTIQGTAADIIKLAMIELQHKIESGELKAKMLIQVHDELVFELDKSELENAKEIIKTTMENAYELSVPLEVDMDWGQNWLEAH